MSAFNSMVALGSGDPLQEAIARRQGMGGAASSTVSPGSPTYDPSTQPPQVPNGTPMQDMSQQAPAPQPQQPGVGQAPMSQDNPNTKIILGAMKDYLGHISQMEAAGTGKPYGA